MMAGETAFAEVGVAVLPGVVSSDLIPALCAVPEMASVGRPGARAFVVSESIQSLIGIDGSLTLLARKLVGPAARPVRVLCFDKTPETNWAVPWHQDRTIAVAGRVDVPGFGPWSFKQGTHHVEPPVGLLTAMVALRLHLDDCGSDNGPLMALSESWKLGRVAAGTIKAMAAAADNVMQMRVGAGGVVAMRGLTIHASAKASRPGHRRVIHVDYATHDLPAGLSWAMT